MQTQKLEFSSLPSSQQRNNKVLIFTFIFSLGLYFAAFLHFWTASLCKNYQNLVNGLNPRYDFQSVISQLVPWMTFFGGYNLLYVLINAALLMFLSSSKRYAPYVIGIIVSALGLIVSVGATVAVYLISSQWNKINNSNKSFFYLHKSVFIGDINDIQHNLRVQFIAGWCFFSPLSIYLICFWVYLLHKTLSSKELIHDRPISELYSKSRANEISIIAKESDSKNELQ